MSDGADYLKYVTERVVSYWETPKTPEIRRERRQKREPWVSRWFGQLLPVGLGIWWNGRKAAHSGTDMPDMHNLAEHADYS